MEETRLNVWFPSNHDFVNTASATAASLCKGGKCKTLMMGMDNIIDLLRFIGDQPIRSIKQLYIIGHGDLNVLSLGGRMSLNFQRTEARVAFGRLAPDNYRIIHPQTLGGSYIRSLIKKLRVRERFQQGAKVIVAGCHTGSSVTLLNALSRALRVCVYGFEHSICWCFYQQRTGVSRGHVWYRPSDLTILGCDPDDCSCFFRDSRGNCNNWGKSLTIFQPDRQSSNRCPRGGYRGQTTNIYGNAYITALPRIRA